MQWIIHYGMHFIVPLGIAYFFFPVQWKKAYGILLLTMLVDLDHVFADPLFDPGSKAYEAYYAYNPKKWLFRWGRNR